MKLDIDFIIEIESDIIQEITGNELSYEDARELEMAIFIRNSLIELKQLRACQLQPAKKFLGNSIQLQLGHMDSEFEEIYNEFDDNWFYNEEKLAMEVIDLQMSCQTFLEGAMGLSKEQITKYIMLVKEKNDARGYFSDK